MSVPTQRLAGLDGLRGIAVGLVVVFHFFPAALPGGFIGVDVFFVISGFLITGLLLTERDVTGRISFGRFWQRRALRLVPPLIPLILIAATAAWLIGGDVLVGLGWQLIGAVTFGYNWVSIAGSASYFSATAPELFRNLWSLAVEEQFYLVWPFALVALLLVRNGRLRIGLVCALALASALGMGLLYQPGDPTRVYYGSDTHSFGLFTGAALALLSHRSGGRADVAPRLAALLARWRPGLGVTALAGVLAAAFLLPDTGAATYRGGLLAVSLLSAVVIWAAVQGQRFGAALDSRTLRYLGERSYGIYLWHWPVLVLLQSRWPMTLTSPTVRTSIVVGLLAVSLTLLAAGASYRWLELPVRSNGVRGSIRRLRSRSARSPFRRGWLALAAVTGLLLAGGTTAAMVTAPHQTSAQSEIERGLKAVDAAERQALQAERRATRSPASAPAPTGTGALITAVGDSVMLASAPELQAGFPGIAIDAAVSRGMDAAPDILKAQAKAGALRPVVVVGLGTNGPIRASQLDDIRAVIGPDRELVLVTAFAEREWTAGVNAALVTFAGRYRAVELANWHDAIAPHTDLLAGDNIHPGPTGGTIYAESVRAALDRLTQMPPAFGGLDAYRERDPARPLESRPPRMP
ncbi:MULTISPECIES: acyltransferase family protein [Cryobacterium]|uniref:Acetyltransferase n=1 Tax=Cryobacterium breve TaxID=1259258 RepID=A0ABY2J0H6_9MICO|nr:MULTISPECIES: acyltransferase family protein [Cryobacterium]TFC91866.1 acetyltransferase [Cryobacterium sp. TmT3-12]TFC98417.1 acetyltransferase [Cryobacterium breve]